MPLIPDVRFEADVLRLALLLGVVREVHVRNWADELLTIGAEPVSGLTEVALAPPELTALREALQPLAAPADNTALAAAILAYLATDPVATARSTADRIRILSLLRREGILSSEEASSVKALEDRSMLAAAGIGDDQVIDRDLDRWLQSVVATRYYRLSLERGDERAALVAALSRKVVRDRRAVRAGQPCKAWIVRPPSSGVPTLLLNEALWRIAITEFSPLPLGARIPYPGIPADSRLVLAEDSAEPMDAQEADALLAG